MRFFESDDEMKRHFNTSKDEITLTRTDLHDLWDELFPGLEWPKNGERLVSCRILEEKLFGPASAVVTGQSDGERLE